MTGNCHVRFQGGKGAERLPTYPVDRTVMNERTKTRLFKGAAILWGCAIGFVLVLMFLTLFWFPAGPWVSIYCPADSDVKMWPLGKRNLTNTASRFSKGPDHIVRDGRLYLRVQSTRPAFVLVTFVDHVQWDRERMMAYRSQHPETQTLWPDIAAETAESDGSGSNRMR